jgi:hypothetical protein
MDHFVGQGVEQYPTQISAQHLGTPTCSVVGLVEQYRAVTIKHAQSLAALMDDRTEFVEQACFLERKLPIVLVDIELAALRTGVC